MGFLAYIAFIPLPFLNSTIRLWTVSLSLTIGVLSICATGIVIRKYGNIILLALQKIQVEKNSPMSWLSHVQDVNDDYENKNHFSTQIQTTNNSTAPSSPSVGPSSIPKDENKVTDGNVDKVQPQQQSQPEMQRQQTNRQQNEEENEHLKQLDDIVMSLSGVVKKVPIILLVYGILMVWMAWWPLVRSAGTYTLAIGMALASLSNVVMLRLFARQILH